MTREDAIKAMAEAIEKLVLKNDSDGKSLTSYLDTATAALASLESLGLAIVPVTATPEMLHAAFGTADDDNAWRFTALIAASPLRKTDEA